MDIGTIIVIIAVLLFYLRLIILQRQTAKRLNPVPVKDQKKKQSIENKPSSVWILSRNRRDWIFAVIGLGMILFGLLTRAGVIPIAQEPIWWIVTAVGLVPFSLGFH